MKYDLCNYYISLINRSCSRMQSNNQDREQLCAYINDTLGNYAPAASYLPVNPNNYLEALHDGILLCYMANVFSKNGPVINETELKKTKATIFHKIDQVNRALQAFKKSGFSLINIRAEYVVEKKENSVLGLFFQLIKLKPGSKPYIKKAQPVHKQQVVQITQKVQKISIPQQKNEPVHKPVQEPVEGSFVLDQKEPQVVPPITIEHPQSLQPVQSPQPQPTSKQQIRALKINQSQKISQQSMNGYFFEKVVGLQAVVLVGSLRKGSVNKGIINALAEIQSRKFMESMYFHIPDLAILPLFNYDLVAQARIPKAVHDLRETIRHSSGVIIATPQYNGTFSGIIKNAFDWLSDSWENSPSPLSSKKIGIVSSSYLTQNQIRDTIEMGDYIKPNYFKQSFYINLRSGPFNMQSGKLTNADQIDRLAYWYQDFSHFLLSGLPNPEPFPRFIMNL